MKFLPVPPPQLPQDREERISEDGNFSLFIHHYVDKPDIFVISVGNIDICPGIGSAKTLAEALERAKASLTAAIASYQERIAQIDTMLEEQKINQGE